MVQGKDARKSEKAALCGCGLLENSADVSASAASSDMAQPIIVAGATTESCAAVGPRRDHGARPYSRRAGLVKPVRRERQLDAAPASREARPLVGVVMAPIGIGDRLVDRLTAYRASGDL
ncbi:hypothetical protein Q3C01_10820 [Bradyrhizobium sp. UFLA05-109]